MLKVKKLIFPINNIVRVLFNYTHLVNVKISLSTIEKILEEHPNYPSMLALKDSLTDLGFKSMALEVEFSQLKQMSFPLITQIHSEDQTKSYFSIIKSAEDNQITYWDPQDETWRSVQPDLFRGQFTGIIILVDEENAKDEINYELNRRKEFNSNLKKWFAVFLLPFFLVVISLIDFNQRNIKSIFSIVDLFLAAAGIAITLMLSWYDMDESNSILAEICTGGDKNLNCGAILKSKAANIWGFSWSLIGLTYFSGYLVVILFLGLSNNGIMAILMLLSILTVPYIFFSIYYQWQIAKVWCRLCLGIQLILVLQIVFSLAGGWLNFIAMSQISLMDIVLSSMAFVVPLTFFSWLFPVFKNLKENLDYKHRYHKLKLNFNVFSQQLKQSKEIKSISDTIGITIGKQNAKHVITLVSSVYCNPCGTAHAAIEKALSSGTDLQLRIIFSNNEDESISGPNPVKHIMAIYANGDEELTFEAIRDWYEFSGKDYEKFEAKFPVKESVLISQANSIKEMREWCLNQEIAFTPTIFLDGYQLPDSYNLKELLMMIRT
jgi:uncharacterized membrane protein